MEIGLLANYDLRSLFANIIYPRFNIYIDPIGPYAIIITSINCELRLIKHYPDHSKRFNEHSK
jgi:hypothetical protein